MDGKIEIATKRLMKMKRTATPSHIMHTYHIIHTYITCSKLTKNGITLNNGSTLALNMFRLFVHFRFLYEFSGEGCSMYVPSKCIGLRMYGFIMRAHVRIVLIENEKISSYTYADKNFTLEQKKNTFARN